MTDKALTDLEEKLVAIAFADVPDGPLRDNTWKAIRDTSGSLYVPCDGDWQSYVDEDLRAIWLQLDLGQRLIAFIGALPRTRGPSAMDE
jgi:hypothetical protein